jgi:RNA polymerase sigma factor (sigma-70 family)
MKPEANDRTVRGGGDGAAAMSLKEAILNLQRNRLVCESWGFIYEHCYYLVFKLVLMRCHDEDMAKDLVEDTFIHVREHICEFDPDIACFTTWLGKIARNLCLNALRGQKRSMERQAGFECAHRKPDQGPIGLCELRTRARKYWNMLTVPERVVVHMHAYEGYTYAEMSEELRMPVRKLKAIEASAHHRIRRARENEEKRARMRRVIAGKNRRGREIRAAS